MPQPQKRLYQFSFYLLALFLAAILPAGCASKKAPRPARPQSQKIRPAATVAHQTLALEKDLGADEQDLEMLDQLLQLILPEIKPQQSYTRQDAIFILEMIHYGIHSMYEYSPVRLLNAGLKDNQLDCDLLTAIYLSVAQLKGLPLKAVVVPQHTFIRWIWPDGGYLNWETTQGRVVDDEVFISGRYRQDAPERQGKKNPRLEAGAKSGAYLRNLNNREFMALAHLNLANAYLEKAKQSQKAKGAIWRSAQQKALKHYRLSIQMDPKRVEAYYGLGVLTYLSGDQASARRYLSKAVSLFPLEPEYYFSRGLVLLAQGELDPAISDLKQAQRLDPANPQTIYFLHQAYLKKGDAKNAKIWWLRLQQPGLAN